MRGNTVVGCGDSLRDEMADTNKTACVIVVSSVIYSGLTYDRQYNGVSNEPHFRNLRLSTHDWDKVRLDA